MKAAVSISVNSGNHVRSVVSSAVTIPPGAVIVTAHSPREPLIVKEIVLAHRSLAGFQHPEGDQRVGSRCPRKRSRPLDYRASASKPMQRKRRDTKA